MKIYKYILESISHINWLGLAPLVFFFVFFVLMTVYVLKAKKSHMDRMSELPLTNEH